MIKKKLGKISTYTLSKTLACIKNISYHLLTVISIIFLAIAIALFLFFALIKTDPDRAASLTTHIINTILPIAQVQAGNISTSINNKNNNENILIIIPHFKRHAKDFEIEGFNARIAFSLSDVIHGRLYRITVEKFLMNIQTQKSQSTYNSHTLARLYYSLIPSLKVDIKDFILNLNNNKINLDDSTLKLNQRGYILYIQANSKQYHYNFKVTLNSKKLRISFQNIPSVILHKYTENRLDFLDFKAATGFILFDAKDTRNANFEIFLQNTTVPQSIITKEIVSLGSITLFGSSSANSTSLIVSPFTINEKATASLSIHTKINTHSDVDKFHNTNITEVEFDIKNLAISEIRNIISAKNIKPTTLKEVVKYLEQSLKSGTVTAANGIIHLPIKENDDMKIDIKFNDTNFEYHPDFAQIEQALGVVQITPNKTTVFLESGKSAANNLKNSTVEIAKSKVKITLNTIGTVKSLSDIFKKNYLISFPISGNITAKTALEIDLLCDDAYHCMKISSNGNITNLYTEFNTTPASGTLFFEKLSNHNASLKMSLVNLKNEYLDIQNIQTEIIPSNNYQHLELRIHGYNNNGEEINAKSIKFNAILGTLEGINLSAIKFKQNNFAFKYENDSMEFKGSSIDAPEIHKFLSKFQIFQNSKPNDNGNHHGDIGNLRLYFAVNKVILYNKVEAFIAGDLNIRKNKIYKALIDSEILSFHYFIPEAEKSISQEVLEQGMFIEIPDISVLIAAISSNPENIVKSGSMKIHAKRLPNASPSGEQNNNQSGAIVWTGAIENINIHYDKIAFNTKKIKILLHQSGNEISFKNIKIQDSNHTIFITGKIFTDTMTIKAKIFYTPSKMETLNEIPVIKDAIKLTTFGTSKNGILSLELDCSGSIFAPTIKLNKAAPIKSLWKLIISIPFLPFLIL